MRHFLLTIILVSAFRIGFAKDTYPSSVGAIANGGATYCLNASATALSVTITTTTCGSGSNTNISTTFQWYSNTTNTTTGGTLVSTVNTTAATTTSTYTPVTTSVGTLYYYCIVSWGDGACAVSGTLTTAVAVSVTTSASRNISSIANGNWTAATTWSGGLVPCSGDNVTVTHTVTVNAVSAANNLTINTGGLVNATSALTVNATFTMGGTGAYTHANTADASTTIFKGTESFSSTSTITFSNWYDLTVPFITNITGSTGNVTINVTGAWDQKGACGGATQRIMGTLTLGASSSVTMDGGAGLSTILKLGDIIDNSANSFIIARGANRNLTLTTGNVTQNTLTGLFSIMYQTHGTLNWTANGNVQISDDFTAIQGGAVPANSPATVQINGYFTVDNTSLFDFNRGLGATTSPVTITVTGSTSVSTSGWFRCMDDGNGDLNFTSNSFAFSNAGNVSNFKYSTTQRAATGNSIVNCTNNFSIATGADVYILGDQNCFSGPSAVACTQGAGSTQKAYLFVGGTLSADNNASNNLYLYKMRGAGLGGYSEADINNIDWNGGKLFFHDANHNSTQTVSVTVRGNFNANFSNTTDAILGSNNINEGAGFPNTIKFYMKVFGSMSISGNASAYFVSSPATGIETIDIVGNLTVNGPRVWFVGSPTAGNDHNIVATVGGNVLVSSGTLIHSSSNGTASWIVTGNYTVNGGEADLKVRDGSSIALTVNGAFSQTAGSFSIHNSNAGGLVASTLSNYTMTVNGDFSHTGGTFDFDDNASSTGIHKLYLNGANYTLNNSGVITKSAGTGTSSVFGELYFNRAGTITFSRANDAHQISQVRQIVTTGCTVNASGSSQDLQISASALAGVSSSPPTVLLLDVQGILTMGTKLIYGRSESTTQRITSVNVASGGELQTANTVGLYDGTTSATFVHLTRNSANTNNTVNSMSWALDANSTVTYNGSASQVVTGKFPFAINTGVVNNDIATGTSAHYKYGKLKINNSTSPASGRCYMTASNVFVRTLLDLTLGEMALGNNANPVTTGYTLTVENGANTAITSTVNSYLASELDVNVNTAILDWQNIGTSTSTYTVPFGRYTTAIRNIPFTMAKGAGDNFSSLKVSTRRSTTVSGSTKLNTPYAGASNVAAVSNMASVVAGVTDGSECCVVDRWWDIRINNAVATTTLTGTATLGFSYIGEENTMTGGSTGEIGIQHWNGSRWDNGVSTSANNVATATGTNGITTTGTVSSVSASGFKLFSPYVLVLRSKPLPVELITFNGECNKNEVVLNWSTATEKNNDYFVIEKSADGINFTEIKRVIGAGNTSQVTNYQEKDTKPLSGTAYYRLKQVDFDGKYSYSDIVEVKSCKIKSNASVFVSPVPAREVLMVNVDTEIEQMVSMKIYDASGRLVALRDVKLSKGSNNIEQSIMDFEAGVYLLQLPMQENILTTRFIKNY